MTRIVPAASGLALATLVAVAAVAGKPMLVGALLLAVVAVAAGWAMLLSLPTPRGSTGVIALGGAVAIAVAALTRTEPYLRWLPVVLAFSLLVEFGHQLLRRDMRPRLVESVTGVVSGVVVVAFGAGWLGALHADASAGLLLAGAAGAAAACAATGLPWPQRITGPASVAGAAAFSALVAGLTQELTVVPGAVLGVGIGVVVASMDRLLAPLPTAGHLPAAVAMGAAPVAASGMVVYTLGRLVA